MEIQIDHFTVVLAAVLNMVIGFFWYSKWLFGPVWKKLTKVQQTASGWSLFYGFIVSLVIAWFLAFFEASLGITTVTDGMFVGFLFWLGFVATTQIGPVIWNKMPFRLFCLNSGFKLLSFLVMSGVIGA
ncbi:MAG: hypothetical protein A3D96_05295 [Chlamydiae bacterium RIFCSPHIGHO2_12_FULL_44_59]|nr:MAG: hypothetical protein A2796_03050 [Chlamydiae bacterium RIFCSPHIGHO2_01_FULL_44_39]OGN57681.1 MAG: hypothetical protein A3C42_06690 [Chlamydiae bacterium RIFCSPHIGHO2_02_FULL_45_9]OGN60229.1 MAG: hypothetical protein A3D96_05295 [Chlamydiae bacterium RIFCSPHIGHO2_12_FULL_44_59]OGN67119.1 MAG: hypothetical protein A2978_00755 [Chlamydiae bacterium RIFCSPLOWO2_01_FULL_44_52]OGN67709.1 MAG: hypothetical protein A3I67_04690 [Chlamydiae bacterium RIFCSPLOWO2_02_FULL_45_22]OGN71412.1 MAG: hyp